MALPQSALSELLEAFRAGDGVDLIRDSVRVALQELIEIEATERIGAAPYERTEDRVNERNVGNRDEQTGQLAKYLDGIQRKGFDAERMLELAVARKPLPVDHPTAALAYRVKDLAARRTVRAAPVDEFRRTAPSSSGPTLGF